MSIDQGHIVLFLRGLAPHPTGYIFDEIVNFEWGEFERRHNMIQWLFPTMHASTCQTNTPVMSWSTVAAIRADLTAQENIKRATTYMSRFYFLHQDLWLCENDHNHLRITRIIESLSLLRIPSDAAKFYRSRCLMNLNAGNPVNEISQNYWSEALQYSNSLEDAHEDYLLSQAPSSCPSLF